MKINPKVTGALAWTGLVLVLAVPAVLVGTVLSALLPARRAATLRPAAVLRSECPGRRARPG